MRSGWMYYEDSNAEVFAKAKELIKLYDSQVVQLAAGLEADLERFDLPMFAKMEELRELVMESQSLKKEAMEADGDEYEDENDVEGAPESFIRSEHQRRSGKEGTAVARVGEGRSKG